MVVSEILQVGFDYDETTEDTYNKYAAEAPEKVYSDFKTDQDYFDWRLNREIELGLPHGLNMVSAEENYNDNANDVRGEKVKEAGADTAYLK